MAENMPMRTIILFMTLLLSSNAFSRDCLKDYHRLHYAQKILGKLRDVYETQDRKVDKVINECKSGQYIEILLEDGSEIDMQSQILNKELDRDGRISADNFQNEHVPSGKELIVREDVCKIYDTFRSEFNEKDLVFFDAHVRSNRLDQDHIVRLCVQGTYTANNFYK